MARISPIYVLCDMDGTLINTEGLKCEAWLRAVAALSDAPPDPAAHQALYCRLAGRPGPEMAEVMVRHYGLQATPHELWERREEFRRSLYSDGELLRSLAFVPMIQFITRLREGHAVLGDGRIVLVTTASQDQVERVMSVLGVGALFHRTISGLEKSGDNPACYEAALSALGCAPEECIALEDTIAGYSAARALGIPCLMLPNEYTRDQRL